MCRTFSGLFFQDGQIVDSDFTDSHCDMIESLGIKDRPSFHDRNWMKYEWVPTDGNYADIESYHLVIDEEGRPAWFTTDMEESLCSRLRERTAKRILIDVDIPILLGGKWILAGTTHVGRLVNSIVVSMRGSSKIGAMCGSSNVGVMRGSSNVGVMRESSNVGEMRESSNVGVMCGFSKIGVMQGSSKIGEDHRRKGD